MAKQTFIDKCFKNKEGRITLFQAPNAPLVLWLASTTLSKLAIEHSTTQRLFSTVAFGALFTWAWLEIFSGVNYFRRVLGGTILVLIVLMRATIL